MGGNPGKNNVIPAQAGIQKIKFPERSRRDSKDNVIPDSDRESREGKVQRHSKTMENEYYELRWQQRYQNFSKAYELLKLAIELENPSVIECAGMIQFFEMAFELAWKLLKDYQEEEGFTVKSPRDAIKIAFQNQTIADGQTWLEALQDRNLTVHTYQEETAQEVERKIRSEYFPILEKLYDTFAKKNKTA